MLKELPREFPGGPVVRTLRPGSIPGQGNKIPHAAWCGQKKKKEKKRRKRESFL